MSRKRNTDRFGEEWSASMLRAVFAKGEPVVGMDPTRWRRDICGALICFEDVGEIGGGFGWEVDHIVPVSRGGDDSPANLQPLHWMNNRAKADSVASPDAYSRVRH